MSKTYRYDPEAGERAKWPVRRRCGRERAAGAAEAAAPSGGETARGEEPEVITPEWAVKRMRTRIESAVAALAADGTIREDEREEYVSMFRARLCAFAQKYDRTRVGEATGRTSSAVNYFCIVIGGFARNIRDYANFRRKHVAPLPPWAESGGDGCGDGAGGVEERLSDGCRCIRELELKMDLQTLFGMLSEEERACLELRLQEFTQEEIAVGLTQRFGRRIDRDRVRKVLMKRIREKAARCGFAPSSRAGRKKN